MRAQKSSKAARSQSSSSVSRGWSQRTSAPPGPWVSWQSMRTPGVLVSDQTGRSPVRPLAPRPRVEVNTTPNALRRPVAPASTPVLVLDSASPMARWEARGCGRGPQTKWPSLVKQPSAVSGASSGRCCMGRVMVADSWPLAAVSAAPSSASTWALSVTCCSAARRAARQSRGSAARRLVKPTSCPDSPGAGTSGPSGSRRPAADDPSSRAARSNRVQKRAKSSAELPRRPGPPLRRSEIAPISRDRLGASRHR